MLCNCIDTFSLLQSFHTILLLTLYLLGSEVGGFNFSLTGGYQETIRLKAYNKLDIGGLPGSRSMARTMKSMSRSTVTSRMTRRESMVSNKRHGISYPSKSNANGHRMSIKNVFTTVVKSQALINAMKPKIAEPEAPAHSTVKNVFKTVVKSTTIVNAMMRPSKTLEAPETSG